MTSDRTHEPSPEPIDGTRIALVGRFAGMSKRDTAKLLRQRGAVVTQKPDASVDLLVVGEHELLFSESGGLIESLDEPLREAAVAGQVELLTESRLWHRLGLVGPRQEIDQLYTPSMLAELLGVPVALVRRWHRRGLIRPVREVRRLPYFDFREVTTARRLAQLLADGITPDRLERKLAALEEHFGDIQRPLDQLQVIVQGGDLLLRDGDHLVDMHGQTYLDFEALDEAAAAAGAAREEAARIDETIQATDERMTPEELFEPNVVLSDPTAASQMHAAAADLEAAGELVEAANMYRAAMATAGPKPELCFELADVLFRLGDLPAARERLYMAVELDEDFVEARANLGCVLAELGQFDLAIAALRGALSCYPDFADAHYHLAKVFDQVDRPEEAVVHWRAFLKHAPDSPWVEEAGERLDEDQH